MPDNTLKILRRKQVEQRLGLSRATIYARMNPRSRPGEYDPTFPKPIALGRKAVGWVESEIDAWIEARIRSSRDGRGCRA